MIFLELHDIYTVHEIYDVCMKSKTVHEEKKTDSAWWENEKVGIMIFFLYIRKITISSIIIIFKEIQVEIDNNFSISVLLVEFWLCLGTKLVH